MTPSSRPGRVGRRPTIADVADAAGVSRTTVSHALNGRGHVDSGTRARVGEVARALGYRPNLRAQRLRTGSAHAIALVSSMPFAVAGGPSRLGFFMEIAAAAAETALTRGYALVLVPPLETRPSLDQLDIDGAIVVEPGQGDPVTEQLSSRGLAIVSVGRQPGADGAIPYVDLDAAATGRLLLDHLYRQDARRIALLIGTTRRHSYVDVEAAYRRFTREHRLPHLLVKADECEGEQAGRRAVAELLNRDPALDAICATVDAFGVGALGALAERGRRVPGDVLVATRYNGLRAHTSRPPLTAVDLHLDQVAERAVELLLEHLGGDTTRRRAPGPAPTLVVRESSIRPSAPHPRLASARPPSAPVSSA